MSNRHKKILRSVSKTAEALLQSSSWEESIQNVLRWLGEATEVSRVYLFECGHDEEGRAAASQRYEWVASGISPQINNAELQQFSWAKHGVEHWYESLAKKQPVVSNLKDLQPEARSHFVKQDIQSLIAVPIHTHQCFWGFVGFDDCVQDREWAFDDIEVLKAAANILGSAIERQRAEEVLLHSHERYQLAERASNIGTWDWDIVTDTTYWSDTIGPLFGFFDGEFCETYEAFLDCVHPDDRETVEESVRASLEDEKEYCCEHRIIWRDGSVHWMLEKGDVFRNSSGQPVRMIGVVQDVTKAKETNQALEASELRFRNLVETTGDWIWEVNKEARYTYASPRVRDLLGYEPGELIGKQPFDLMPESEAARVSEVFAEIAKNKRPFERLENINLHRNGHQVVIETSGVPIIDAEGELVGYRGIDRDVTDRKSAEQALRDSNELFRQLADNVREVFFVKDYLQDEIIYVSPACEEIWGDTTEHICRDAQCFLKFIHPDDKESINDRCLCSSGSEDFDGEFRIVRPDDSVHWIWWRSFPIRNEAGEIYRIVCIAYDITERKEAEQKRLLHEKEQRVTLVREVHHRVKNNLQGIIGLLQQQLGVHPDLHSAMEGAIEQISAIAIVYGLQGKKDPENVYLCEVVTAIANQARATSSKPVEVCLALQIECPLKVRSEEAVPLALVINELVTNAVKHSTRNGGICIDFTSKDGRGVLIVTNSFDVDLICLDYKRGLGLGTGLELARSLMPKSGASLDISVVENEVSARLEVYPPVVQMDRGVECPLVLGESGNTCTCSERSRRGI